MLHGYNLAIDFCQHKPSRELPHEYISSALTPCILAIHLFAEDCRVLCCL
jgi:hypothetical protein